MRRTGGERQSVAVTMVVGPDTSGRLIEIGYVDSSEARIIVHAMPARPKYLPR
jgi:hypothetical protein